jgi:cysteine-rich repeat protein
VCGNGIVESAEECDDGNSVEHDGCFACEAEGACCRLSDGACQRMRGSVCLAWTGNRYDGDGTLCGQQPCP